MKALNKKGLENMNKENNNNNKDLGNYLRGDIICIIWLEGETK